MQNSSRCLALLAYVTAGLISSLPAQQAASAAVARTAFRSAAALLASGDTAAAADSALAGVRAWPRQGGYLLTAARIASLDGRRDESLALLTRASKMGFGWSAANPMLDQLRDDPRFAEVASTAVAALVPLKASEVMLQLADSTLHPEGVAWDPATKRLFVSSIRHSKVMVIDRDGRVSDFTAPGAGLEAVFGMAVDSARGMLWVASSRTPEQTRPAAAIGSGAEIMALDLATGAVRERWRVADTINPHLIGDVTIAPDGSVWGTDSRTPALYRLMPDGRGGLLAPHAFHSRDWASLQGLAFSPAGDVAWLADWTTGLFRIDLATGAIDAVDADVDDMILGIDGLYAVGPTRLVGLQNGIAPPRIVELELTVDGRSIAALRVIDRHLPVAEEPTLGVLVDGSLIYVANSPWGYYQDGKPDTSRRPPAPVLLRLPLGP